MKAFDATHICRRDAVIATAIGASLGAIAMAMLMTGSRIPLKCYEAGDLANWTAAIGTWIIGIGACKIAYDANARRAEEVQENRERQRAARRTRLRHMLVGARIAKILHRQQKASRRDGLREQRNTGNQHAVVTELRGLFKIAQKKHATVRWDEEDRAALDERALDALVDVEHDFLAVSDYIEQFLAKYPSDDAPFEVANCRVLKWLIAAADDLQVDGRRFEKELNRLLDSDH